MDRRKWMLGCAGLALVGLLVVGVPAGLILNAFRGNAPLEDGRELADGKVVTVLDVYVSCYLVDVGDGAWVLVDGCMDKEAKGISAALSQRGASLSDVKAILLTHGHDDHIGAAAAAPQIPVRAMAAEKPQLEGIEPYHGPLPGMMGKVDTGIRVTEPLVDGGGFQIGDTHFEAFAVPGHTPGSAAILADGVLFVGDNASWKARGELVIAPWIFSDDTDRNAASLRTLAGRLKARADEIHWIAPAHTGPAEGLSGLTAF